MVTREHRRATGIRPVPTFPTRRPEALTPEERRELDEALGEMARGELVPHDEIRRGFSRD